MHFLRSIVVAGLAAGALAAEIAPNAQRAKELYENGVQHEKLMAKKHASWAKHKLQGLFDSRKYKHWNKDYVPCVNGFATAIPGDKNNTFRCSNIDLYDFKSHADLSSTGEGSSSWGWTSDNGREFVAIGQQDGTAFVEITKKGKMEYLGRLPQYSVPSIWREIRSYKHYMLIGSEAVGHGVQIFDMRKLLKINPRSPVNFTQSDLTGHFNELPVGRTHNVVVNEEEGYAVAVGAQPRNSTCRAGLIFIDLKDISKPTSPGCNGQDGYVHDAQCLVYRGPHKKYYGRSICYGYNEDTLTIYDVTDKKNSTIISRTSYEGASYTHQGWVLDTQWQEYLLMDDELDEIDEVGPGADGYFVTFIWDIRNLEQPKQTGIYKSQHHGIDHNQYVIDGLAYQSNYGAGLHVLDVSSIPKDPSGKGVKLAGFFDIYPEDDHLPEGGIVDFVGTWSHYAYFKSGFIFVNTIERGAFVVKMQNERGRPSRGRGNWGWKQ